MRGLSIFTEPMQPNKFVPNLLLTNKTMDVYRLNPAETVYEEHIKGKRMRYKGLEPVETALRIVDNIREQVMLISSGLMTDIIDIEISDYIHILEDDVKFVVTGIQRHDELNLSYKEVLIRQLDSKIHKKAKILRNTEDQTNYDPVYNEWIDKKSVEEIEISVLFTTEPLKNRGETAGYTTAGTLDEGLYMFIVDLPVHPKITDRILYAGEEYYIQRIEDLLFQYEIRATKILPNGKQFSDDSI